MTTDGFVDFNDIAQPDKRNLDRSRLDEFGRSIPYTFEHHYRDIALYGLDEHIPEDVRRVYDRARNVYVYAWFEYHFYVVAEGQALASLEFALKTRIDSAELELYRRQNRMTRGLKLLMSFAADKELVRNKEFRVWWSQSKFKAEQEYIYRQAEELNASSESSQELDLDAVTAHDLSIPYNHVKHLAETTPNVRNEFAHGTSMVNFPSIGRLEMVSEYVNALYREKVIDD